MKYEDLAAYILWRQVGSPDQKAFKEVTGLEIKEPAVIVSEIKNSEARVMHHHNPWLYYFTSEIEPTTKEIIESMKKYEPED